MNKAEELFQRLIELIDCTAWDFRYIADCEGTDLGDSQARIYLVDTHTGWYAHAAISVNDFKAAAVDLQRSDITHDEVALVTNQLIHSFKGETITAEDAQLYLAFTALWLTGTETFRQLNANNALGAHLFAFSYATQSGMMVLRPTAAVDHSINFYPIEEVLGVTRQIISMDIKNDKSHVGQSLQREGGAMLSPLFD